MFQTGDILFKKGTSTISQIIQKLTFSEVTHTGLFYDSDTLFETDGAWQKAKFRDVFENYKGKSIEVYRMKGMNELKQKYVKALCEEYEDTPYSYWDIAVKGVLFWLHPKIRGKIDAFLGTQKFMICNELTMMIMYKTTGHEMFKNFESSSPAELYESIKMHPFLFQRVV